jgi:hypothetical protein
MLEIKMPKIHPINFCANKGLVTLQRFKNQFFNTYFAENKIHYE